MTLFISLDLLPFILEVLEGLSIYDSWIAVVMVIVVPAFVYFYYF